MIYTNLSTCNLEVRLGENLSQFLFSHNEDLEIFIRNGQQRTAWLTTCFSSQRQIYGLKDRKVPC